MAASSGDVKISKALSYLLRHGAEKEKIEMRSDGFVKLDDLLKHRTLKRVTRDEIERIVKNCPKQRFAIKIFENETYVRANQGHSLTEIQVDMIEIDENSSIKSCIHGTFYKAWDSIKLQGLSRMNRQHIHLSEDFPGSKDVISGMRHDCEIAVFIDVTKALKDGIRFFKSANNVILCPGDEEGFLKPKYFMQVRDLIKKQDIEGFVNAKN